MSGQAYPFVLNCRIKRKSKMSLVHHKTNDPSVPVAVALLGSGCLSHRHSLVTLSQACITTTGIQIRGLLRPIRRTVSFLAPFLAPGTDTSTDTIECDPDPMSNL
jgi:hypothetical protein